MDIDLNLLLSHWPLLVVAFILGVIGDVMKRLVIPKGNPPVLKGWRGVFRVTLPLHPVLAGAALGLLAGMPCPENFCTNATSRMLYFAAAGVFSSYVYGFAKHVARERLGANSPV